MAKNLQNTKKYQSNAMLTFILQTHIPFENEELKKTLMD